MLVELLIENYAVVENARLRFFPGLNLLTGETGSGKSIIVDALALLYGDRASAEVVRAGAAGARIAGIFEIPSAGEAAAAIHRLLEAAGLEAEQEELLIEREISATGKSRAFLGNRPVTVSLLRELAPYLGDIHGQHDQQRLFFPAAQLEFLDAYGRLGELAEAAGAAFAAWDDCRRRLETLEREEQEKLRLLDLYTFQRKEIEMAALRCGEDAELEQERKVLLNLTRLQEFAQSAYDALYDGPSAALGQVRLALRRVQDLSRIDAALEPLLSSLAGAEITIQDASFALRDYLGRLEANPARLEEIETRLALLDRLKRKYGATLEEVLAFLDETRRQIARIENAESEREELRRRLTSLAATYEDVAGRLSAARRQAADRLAREIQNELRALAMPGASFQIQLSRTGWSPCGFDAVKFLVSANKGEEPKPLEKVASGGEISRIALAIKTCIAAADTRSMKRGDAVPRTLVFDEVDAGVGGKAAESIGRRLKRLSATEQVLCVTHLPQIASFADHHFFVDKREKDGRTVAEVIYLSEEQRVAELGRMLSGAKLTAEALQHARQLLAMNRGEAARA